MRLALSGAKYLILHVNGLVEFCSNVNPAHTPTFIFPPIILNICFMYRNAVCVCVSVCLCVGGGSATLGLKWKQGIVTRSYHVDVMRPSIHSSWKNMDHHHYTSYVVLSYLIGCEYGDKSTACSAIEARQCYDPFNEDLCCGSCATFFTGYPGKRGYNEPFNSMKLSDAYMCQ